MHQQLLTQLAESVVPLTTRNVATVFGGATTAEALAALELVAMLAPELRQQGNGWVLRADTPSQRILAALHAYASANPTRSVFRAAAALGSLPAHEQPTEEQLRLLLATSADFKLLSNAMIKRVS
jgi:hypothetical protein